MDISRILKFMLIIEATVLLTGAAAISIDYQDSWILQGLEIPFAIFAITYAIYVFTENKITWIMAFALIFRSVILLIPNLKYPWFQGVAIDQHEHYKLTVDIFQEGRVPDGRLYSGTPLMHMAFVVYTMATSAPILYSFKYFPILAWLAYPLTIYLIMKELSFTKNSSLLKYVLIVSSIPTKSTTSYLVIGTLFGTLLSFLIILQLIRIVGRKDRRDWIIAIVLMFALVATHSYSSIMLIAALLTMYLVTLLLQGRVKSNLPSLPASMMLVVLSLSWLSFQAQNIMQKTVNIESSYIERLMGLPLTTEVPVPVPLAFFELSFIDAIKIVLVYNGADILLMLFTSVGIAFVAKKSDAHFKSKDALLFLSLYIVSMWILLATGVSVFQFGEQWYDRILRLSLAASPIFTGVSLFYISKRTHDTKIIAFIIMLLMTLGTVELYGYQPLIPSASSISRDLPTDEPLVYVVMVNTAYQRYMIRYAERYVPEGTSIASDRVTHDQAISLTSYNFSRGQLLWYYPISRLFNERIREKEYDYFLIHLPEKSGAFREAAEMRTTSLVLQSIHYSSIIYTNGESYVLTRPFWLNKILNRTQ